MRKEVSRLKELIWVLMRILAAGIVGRKIWLDFMATVDSYPDEQKKTDTSGMASDETEGD